MEEGPDVGAQDVWVDPFGEKPLAEEVVVAGESFGQAVIEIECAQWIAAHQVVQALAVQRLVHAPQMCEGHFHHGRAHQLAAGGEDGSPNEGEILVVKHVLDPCDPLHEGGGSLFVEGEQYLVADPGNAGDDVLVRFQDPLRDPGHLGAHRRVQQLGAAFEGTCLQHVALEQLLGDMRLPFVHQPDNGGDKEVVGLLQLRVLRHQPDHVRH